MGELEAVFARFDRIMVLDTETTGLSYERDEIIELAAVTLTQESGRVVESGAYDRLIALSPGRYLPRMITEMTGITPEALRDRGIPKAQACRDLMSLVPDERTLVAAYNAQFDLSFLLFSLLRCAEAERFRQAGFLDLLTVYRDRRAYPHKLKDAIEAYGLGDRVQNSHHALDDVRAAAEVLLAMDRERPDLENYVNRFGYLKKYGLAGRPLGGITYRPQELEPGRPIYER